MRRLASVVTLLLLISAAGPVLACMTGTSAMSQEESACCRAMHGRCGEMAKMGCCRMEVRHDLPQQTTQATTVPRVQWVLVSLLQPSLSFPLAMQVSKVWNSPDEHSPPSQVAAETTVLQI